MADLAHLQKFFIAYYGRPADKTGQDYWAGEIDAGKLNDSNGDLDGYALGANFGNAQQSEYVAVYGDNPTAEEFIAAVFQNLFNRTPDTAGADYWKGIYDENIAAGDTADVVRAKLAIWIMDGAQPGTDDAAIVANKISYSESFTAAQDTAEEQSAFAENEAAKTLARDELKTITNEASSVDTAKAKIDTVVSDGVAAANPGTTFTLTADTDIETLDSGNNTVAAAQGHLNDTDVILDNSTTDKDVLTAEVTTAGIKARLQNIETVNIDGKFATTGFDLENTAGTTDLNLNTAIASGTATVLNASTLNAVNINAGANINTVAVTATASGTRDTVNINAGQAKDITVNGGAGTDQFSVTAVADSTIELTVGGGASDVDTHTLNTSGGKYSLDGNATAKTVTINNTTEAATVTLVNDQDLVGVATGSGFKVTGDKAVTLVTGKVANLHQRSLADENAESTTLKITDTAITTAADLKGILVDTVELSGTGTDTMEVTVNEGSVVNLTGNASADDAVTLNVDNAKGSVGTAAGALVVNVSETQTGATSKLVTGAKVGTLVLSATPDEASDTANDAVISIKEVDTATHSATTVVINGDADLKIETLSNEADSTIGAADMTGKLIIEDVANAATISLGSGGSDISASAAVTIHGGAGKDKLTGSGLADVLNGNDGDDTLLGGGDADVISTGAGTDAVNGGSGEDTITLGAGADTVTMDAGEDGDTIKSFTVGEDKLVLIGDSANVGVGSELDLTELTATAPTNGTYQILHTTFDFTLSDVNLTDLSNVVQLGNATTAFDVGTATTVVASDFADNIVADVDGVTLTAGLGADKILLAATGNPDTLIVAAGDSTTDAYDTVTNFLKDEDVLDLDSTTVATNGSHIDGATDVGVFAKHTIADGIITFEDSGDAAVTLSIGNFESAIDYLEANIADGETVAFEFAGNTFVFQGDSTSDVMIELIGVTGADAVTTATGGTDDIIIA